MKKYFKTKTYFVFLCFKNIFKIEIIKFNKILIYSD